MKFDHFAVSGRSLEDAVSHVETVLGVAMHRGGRHERFGTHNALLGLGDGLYLEAISIDPEAAPPPDPRWFDLDRFSGAPRITNWVVSTEDMERELPRLSVDAGRIVDLKRDQLTWKMAVPEDGILPYDGAFPAIIQWTSGRHPSRSLPESGCRLSELVISHPDAEALQECLRSKVADPRVRFEAGPIPAFVAEIKTPSGLKVLQ